MGMCMLITRARIVQFAPGLGPRMVRTEKGDKFPRKIRKNRFSVHFVWRNIFFKSSLENGLTDLADIRYCV